MTGSDTTQDSKLACVEVGESVSYKSRASRMRGRLGQCAAGISTATLGITVAAMAMALCLRKGWKMRRCQ